MGGQSCKAKAILNGGAVQDTANRLCYQIQVLEYDAFTDDQWTKIIEHLNAAEDSMNRAVRTFLELSGFAGPWPKALK